MSKQNGNNMNIFVRKHLFCIFWRGGIKAETYHYAWWRLALNASVISSVRRKVYPDRTKSQLRRRPRSAALYRSFLNNYETYPWWKGSPGPLACIKADTSKIEKKLRYESLWLGAIRNKLRQCLRAQEKDNKDDSQITSGAHYLSYI